MSKQSKAIWSKNLFNLLVFALLFTGLAQMPIFKRYYLADIPGFAWTADFYLNHILHYILATILLFWIFFRLGKFLRQAQQGIKAISPFGWAKIFIWAGIIITGILRVLKNQPNIFFSPETTMFIDWTHPGLVIILGLTALLGKFLRQGYFKG